MKYFIAVISLLLSFTAQAEINFIATCTPGPVDADHSAAVRFELVVRDVFGDVTKFSADDECVISFSVPDDTTYFSASVRGWSADDKKGGFSPSVEWFSNPIPTPTAEPTLLPTPTPTPTVEPTPAPTPSPSPTPVVALRPPNRPTGLSFQRQ